MKYLVRISDILYEVEVERVETGGYALTLQGRRYEVQLKPLGDFSFQMLLVDGVEYPLHIDPASGSYTFLLAGAHFDVEMLPEAAAVLAEVRALNPGHHSAITVKAPMPGLIKEVSVKQGDSVTKGQRLLVLEAMKMNNEIRAPGDGTVKSVPVVQDQRVNAGEVLMLLE